MSSKEKLNYSVEEIEKIKMVLDVINIRLSISHKPHIIYIPFQDFSANLQRFEIISLLHKLDKDLKVINFTQITDGQKLADQQVCVRVADDKIKFNELKKIVDEKYLDISKKDVAGKTLSNECGDKKCLPYTIIDGKWGYFKFFKQGEKIKIGNICSRHFRLLDCLCQPKFGEHKSLESVLDAIRIRKDNKNTNLSLGSLRKQAIMNIIINTKKELQKNKKLQGKINYIIENNTMWIEKIGE